MHHDFVLPAVQQLIPRDLACCAACAVAKSRKSYCGGQDLFQELLLSGPSQMTGLRCAPLQPLSFTYHCLSSRLLGRGISANGWASRRCRQMALILQAQWQEMNSVVIDKPLISDALDAFRARGYSTRKEQGRICPHGHNYLEMNNSELSTPSW